MLLHRFPANKFMFRCVIPLGADQYHVIAPDHLGFGLSDAPATDEFHRTFHVLAVRTADLLHEPRLSRYARYPQDYGAPICRQFAVTYPQAITAVTTQNGNAHGLVQLALFADHETNLPLYPEVRAWLRDSRDPVLAVWGPNDEIFSFEGRGRSDWLPPTSRSICCTEGHFLLEANWTLSWVGFATSGDGSVLSGRSCP